MSPLISRPRHRSVVLVGSNSSVQRQEISCTVLTEACVRWIPVRKRWALYQIAIRILYIAAAQAFLIRIYPVFPPVYSMMLAWLNTLALPKGGIFLEFVVKVTRHPEGKKQKRNAHEYIHVYSLIWSTASNQYKLLREKNWHMYHYYCHPSCTQQQGREIWIVQFNNTSGIMLCVFFLYACPYLQVKETPNYNKYYGQECYIPRSISIFSTIQH